MIARFFLLATMLLITINCNAQQFVSVMDQVFTVHSSGNALVNSNSTSRNFVEVHFPAKTVGYVYRVSAQARSSVNGQSAQLLELLNTIAPKQIVMGTALTQFAIQQADGDGIDIFAFNNAGDVNNFLKKTGQFLAGLLV